MTERSVLAYDSWKTSQEKFDYFILGVIGALCAYLSQNIQTAPLGFNSPTLELTGLLVILVAGIAGFLRLEAAVELYGLSHHRLHLNEKKGQLVSNFNGGPLINSQTGQIYSPGDVTLEVGAIDEVLPDLDRKMNRLQSKTLFYYRLRNYFLLVGFLIIVGARVWQAYEIA